jgi:ATP phosphoribosyltransferase regulatory subunit
VRAYARPGDGLGVLAHPLPAGMRDFLPPDARRQADLARDVIACFELFGYELITLPVFEYEEVLERGLGDLDAEEMLRFVEPESGSVVALRPDMTPQIARVLSTRLRETPCPARLCYHGSVLRRRRERARRHRQIPQAGIELVGLEGPSGDLEILSVAAAAVRAAGLADFVIDLGHARIAQTLLAGAREAGGRAIVEALAIKDSAEVARRAGASGLGQSERRALAALTELHGNDRIWERASRALSGTAAEAPLAELRRIHDVVQELALAPAVVVDLGETRSFAYYTGTTFQIHARGPGRPVASGGRYDGLLEGFGVPRPAAGFAFDLDDLSWALGELRAESRPLRVLLAPSAASLGPAQRALGIACAQGPDEDALSYARAWRYTHHIEVAEEALVTRVSDQASRRVAIDPSALARTVRSAELDPSTQETSVSPCPA